MWRENVPKAGRRQQALGDGVGVVVNGHLILERRHFERDISNWARENLHREGRDVDEEWQDERAILRKWSVRWSMVDGERTAEGTGRSFSD